MPPSDLTNEQWDEIYTRAIAGESVKTIAREFGRSDTAVYRLLGRRYGYRAPVHRRGLWKPTYTPPTSVAEIAYTAGIFDGEGSLMRVIRPDWGSRPSWIARVNMVDEPLIRWLHSFGGTFQVRPSRMERRLEQYEWKLARQADVLTFASTVLPYLWVKRTRAEEAIAEIRSLAPQFK